MIHRNDHHPDHYRQERAVPVNLFVEVCTTHPVFVVTAPIDGMPPGPWLQADQLKQCIWLVPLE